LSVWRRLHKYLGLLVFAQLLVWVGSGVILSILDAGEAGGRNTRIRPAADFPLVMRIESPIAISDLPIQFESVHKIGLRQLLGHPVFQVETGNGTELFDAKSGQPFRIDEARAKALALDTYGGGGAVIDVNYLASGSADFVSPDTALWQVSFDDERHTMAYITAADGRLVLHRNDTTQWVDFLLMLHFMDYLEENSFNNIQVIVLGFCMLWLAMSGLILLYNSLVKVGFR